MEAKIGRGKLVGEEVRIANPTSGHGNLTNTGGAAELGEAVDGGFALAGADDSAVFLVGDVIDVKALALGGPGGAVTTEHEVVLDGKLEASAGELALDGSEGGEPAAIGQALDGGVACREPACVIQPIDGVIEIHGTFPSVGDQFSLCETYSNFFATDGPVN
jgi:hypothetical protein